jgi:aspartate kinase
MQLRNMMVMKFGGSSVKDPEAIGRVATIIKGRLARKPVIVVSAFGDTTDALVDILDGLEIGKAAEARRLVDEIAEQHRVLIEKLLPAGAHRERAVAVLASGMKRLSRLIDGMESLGEVSARSRDAVLATGELMAGPMLAAFLAHRGLPSEAVDPTRVILTDDRYGAASPDVEETGARCREVLTPLLESNLLPVVGGYVAANAAGVVTTLGRGGSDLTASLIARAFHAEALEYWKDVDGILTADPRLVEKARPVPRLTFREAAELAFLGARVLHPASIQPAVEAGVPVRVLNSYCPDAPGTLITESAPLERPLSPERAVTSVAYKRGQALVNVYSTRMLGASGFLRRVFEVFDRLSLSVDLIATSEVNITVTVGQTALLDRLRSELAEVAAVQVESGVGVVSVVGERLHETAGVAAAVFRALHDVNIKLITYGGSGVNLSLVVDDTAVPQAVRDLHQELCPPGC